jgi:hypothetical protein
MLRVWATFDTAAENFPFVLWSVADSDVINTYFVPTTFPTAAQKARVLLLSESKRKIAICEILPTRARLGAQLLISFFVRN